MVRTKLNRYTAMLLSFLMILSSFSALTAVEADAAGSENYVQVVMIDLSNIKWVNQVSFHEPYSNRDYTYFAGSFLHKYIARNLDGSNETVAYCIQPGTRLPDSATWENGKSNAWDSLGKAKHSAIKYALYFGYQKDTNPNDTNLNDTNLKNILGSNAQIKGTADERRTATQLIIWEIVCGNRDPYTMEVEDDSFAKGLFGTNYNQNTGVRDAYRQIEEAILRFKEVPSFSDTSKRMSQQYVMKWDGTKYSVTLVDDNNVLSRYVIDPINGVEVKKSGNTLTLSSKNPLNNAVSVTVKTSPNFSSTSDSVVVYGNSNAGIQDVVQCSANLKPDPVPSYFTLKTEAQGALEVTKEFVSEDGTNLGANIDADTLSNTKFKIKNSVGKYITATKNGGVYTYSDANTTGTEFLLTKDSGDFYFQVYKLPVGTYTVIEQDSSRTGYKVSGSSNISVTIRPNETARATFENKSSQLTIDKTFFKTTRVTDDDYRNIALRIQQSGSSGYVKVKVVDAANNVYQYSTSGTTSLTFVNPRIHNITVLGLPVKNSSGAYYTYTVSEEPNGKVTGKPIANRYTYNTVSKTFQSGMNQSVHINNTEKSEGYIEIQKDFEIEKTDGTTEAYRGDNTLSLSDAYENIYFYVKNSSGQYVTASKVGSDYEYKGTVGSVGNATQFKIEAGDYDHKIELSKLPYDT